MERLAFEVTRNEIGKHFIIVSKFNFYQHHYFLESMIGDVNLFIDMEHGNKAEIEIMIAEELARGRGYGIESTAVMMLYGIEQLDIPTFQAKIGKSNEKSIKMFQQLGFEVIGTNEKFKEVIYEKHVEEDWIDYIKELCGFEMCDYNVEEK